MDRSSVPEFLAVKQKAIGQNGAAGQFAVRLVLEQTVIPSRHDIENVAQDQYFIKNGLMALLIQFVKVSHWKQKTVISKSYVMEFSNGQAGQHGRPVSSVLQQDLEHASTNVANHKLKLIISIVKGTADNLVQIKLHHAPVRLKIVPMVRTGYHWLILMAMTSPNVPNLEVPIQELDHLQPRFKGVTHVDATIRINYFLDLENVSKEANAIVSFVEK